MEHKERLAEAGRKCGLWLRHAHLCAGHLGRVAGDKVVHDLRVGELRDRRKHASGVAREQHNVLRVAVGQAWDFGGRNEVDRVSASSVLGDHGVCVIHHPGDRVVHHVFEHRAKPDCIENFWLFLGRQIETLGVAAALDVENTVVGPAMLVIADQLPVRVCAERGFSCSRQTKEERHVAVLHALVGRRVQCQHLVLHRHEVKHHGENTLFHLTSVLGSQNDHLHLLEVDLDTGGRRHAFGEHVRRELAGVPDREVWLAKVAQLLVGGSDQHVLHEQCVVGPRTDDSHLDSVARVPASKGVDDVHFVSGSEVVDSSALGDLPGLLVNLLVDRSPPDVLCRRLLVDNSLVLRRAARF
ncbi:hypothetical protein OGATHE_003710 [Ogataea polymorpha]|uniref:Uncharacterized protein n=1 Tax=Ogataea polymorpha TaxID=460523 RepID=A0A9P8T4B6_9ASCO|nr:hypothetical protein OGATHE_003710 [Ogataea polymorpha]